MAVYKRVQYVGIASMLLLLLTSCFSPPYNNFKPIVGLAPNTPQAPVKAYFGSRASLLNELKAMDIEFINYGDTNTLVVPTDRYFLFNSPHFNQLCYPGLIAIIQLVKQYPNSTFYVAGFTDNVGSRFAKDKLSQARAETMLTYLWANGIAAKQLHAEGYGEKYAVADNHLIHGSAQNRRLEIQWIKDPNTPRTCCIINK